MSATEEVRNSTSLPVSPFDRDLFEVPPEGQEDAAVDLSDMAESVRPSGPMAPVDEDEGLDEVLTPRQPRPRADVDFLLGLSGSPGTAAAISPPLLDDLSEEEKMESPSPMAVAPTASRASITPTPTINTEAPSQSTVRAPSSKSRVGAGVALLLLGAAAAATVAISVARTRADAEANATSTLEGAPHAALPGPTLEQPPQPTTEAVPETLSAPAPLNALADSPAAPNPPPTAPKESPARKAVEEKPAVATRAVVSAPEAQDNPTPAVVLPVPSRKPAPAPAAPGQAFDRDAAASALSTVAAEAASCRKPGDPSGVAVVTVTFAPSGRVTSATVSGPPFAGTQTGGCIASTLRRAQVPAFDGDKTSVGKTIVVK
jgi:hypothetical protein